ncbi:MAG: VWA domain-containing protein [Leptolyngbya sp. SIOISBB]|nr:VWA domain-containing protein [Leptolyngbya sp. SIOISBB]
MTPSPSSTQPMLELLPLHGAIVTQQPMTLDVLVRITPPALPIAPERSPLNLSLVIDRSGSMRREKIQQAQEAACFAMENLLPSDRLSVVLFGNEAKTLIPSTFATDKQPLLAKIRQVQARGSTALHAGWVEGGTQVSQYLNSDQLNRVILFSDGQANVGETRPDAIANDVHGLAQHGVSTTTLGIGQGYNEDLLVAMANSGDGNFFHIESAEQLADIFETELSGLAATIGQRVSLGIEPQNGVKVLDVLNDFELTDTQRYKLPNLVIGSPINVVVRLQVPALTRSTELFKVRLAWDDRQQPQRQTLHADLLLPLVNTAQFSDFPADETVQQQVALLMAARARKEAIAFADRGDMRGAQQSLSVARAAFSTFAPSPALSAEQAALQDLELDYAAGRSASARKKALSQEYNLRRSGKSNPRRSMKHD